MCRKKRETSYNGDTRRTWMSSFILFLIKYCLLPISIENEIIIFKIFSWKTFMHCCVSFGYMMLLVTLPFSFTHFNLENFYKVETSFAINFSLTLISLSNVFGLLIPLIISDGLTSLNANFITSTNLRVPPKGYRIIIGKLFFCITHLIRIQFMETLCLQQCS